MIAPAIRPSFRQRRPAAAYAGSLAAFLPVLVTAALLGGCTEPRAAAPGVTAVSDSAGVRIVEASGPLFASPATPILVDSSPSLVIGTEDNDDAYQLHRVSDALRLPDGRIVVANAGSSELRVFDSTGRFVVRVGRAGSGPGEFAAVSTPRLFLAAGELLASDPGVFRLHAFDSTLTLIETRRFTLTQEISRPLLQGVLDDASWLALAFDGGGTLRGLPGTVIGTSFALTLFDARGRFVRRFGSFDGRKRYVNEVGETTHYPPLPFTVNAVVKPFGEHVLVVRGDRPEIELWDATGTLSSLIRWPRERIRSADLYPRYRQQAVAALATAGERDRRLYGAFYAKEIPLPEFAALYDEVVVDAEQRIWLHRYRLPGDLSASHWDLIDRTGRWLGTVPTPPGLQVFQIGRSHLLGRVRDSLGIERVVVHPVRAAP